MGTQKSRKEKIEFMRENIQDFFKKYPDGQIDKFKLLSSFVLKFNTSKRTGLEILDALEESGEFEYLDEDEGLIVGVKQ